jgi:hypothetical protein
VQHIAAMFGATFLVPIITGFPPTTTLFFSGVGTLLFLAITQNKVPSYLGSSFAFLAPIAAAQTGGGMSAALGGVVVTGLIPDRINSIPVKEIINNDSLKSIRNLDDIYRISNYVCNDPILHKMIGQVYREKNGDFVLIPIVGDQKIILGTAQSDAVVKDKFERLLDFYKEAMPFEGWNKYSEISVKYEGQIVCRKRAN